MGERSRYFDLWRSSGRGTGDGFVGPCQHLCGADCQERSLRYTPEITAGSTLRPFACGESEDGSADACAAEMVVDVQGYRDVCLERCNVTCSQRSELFALFGNEILSV